jgi:putative intracellular protease/amidase
MQTHSVLIVVFDDVQSLDVTGPLEVFTSAGRCPDTAGGGYEVLVPGGQGTRAPAPELISWLRERAPTAGRVVSVCTGTFLLDAGGLLVRRRATTHWAYCESLARRFPDVLVDPEPIFIRDGTSRPQRGLPRESISRSPLSRRTSVAM